MAFAGKLMTSMVNAMRSTTEEIPAHSSGSANDMDEDLETMRQAATTKTLHRWKRMVMLLGIQMLHASTGALIVVIEEIRERKAKEALELYLKAVGRAQSRLTVSTGGTVRQTNRVDPAKVLKGKTLTRSSGHFRKMPADCDHPLEECSQPRGTKNLKWWTCLECGSRWERLDPNQNPASTATSGSAMMLPSGSSGSANQMGPALDIPSSRRKRVSLPVEDIPQQIANEFDQTWEMYKHQGLTREQICHQIRAQTSAENQKYAAVYCELSKTFAD